MSPMSRARARHLPLAAVLALAATLLVARGAGATTCASEALLVPVLRDASVNQGIEAYDFLVPAKRTVVRTYLSKPSCAGPDERVVVTGGRVLVDLVGGDVTPIALGSAEVAPTPPLTNPLDLPSAGLAPLGGPADLTFLVPRDAVDPVGAAGTPWDAPFTSNLTVELRYRSSTDGTTFGPERVATYPLTAPFGARQSPLRVLVVPMVDGGLATEWDAVRDTVTAALDTVDRELPLATDVTGIDGDGGLRYTVHPTGVDLNRMGPKGDRDLLPDGGFCNGAWTVIRTQLEELRKAANSSDVNVLSGVRYDRVLGVVPSSLVSSDCKTRGWGDYPGSVAYVVADPSRPWTGSIAALELGHTLHLVPPGSPNEDPVDRTHSENIAAEGDGRAFDTHTGVPIANDHSLMNFDSTPAWGDATTLVEAHEWTYAHCRIQSATAGTNRSCTDVWGVRNSPGTTQERFVLVGQTNGTPEGTIVNSYAPASGVSEATDDGSRLWLVQRNAAGAIEAKDGVPVTQVFSHHHGDDGGGTGHLGTYHFDLSVLADPDTEAFELYHGDPEAGSAVLLYRRTRDGAPQVVSTSHAGDPTGPRTTIADSGTADDRAALSPDGSMLAWIAGSDLHIAPIGELRDDPQAVGSPLVNGVADVAWNGGGTRIAYATTGGDVFVATVDGSSLRDAKQIYFPSSPPITYPVTSVSWSADAGAGTIAATVEYGDGADIWLLDPDATVPLTPVCARTDIDLCPRATRSPERDAEPSWHAAGLVYECARSAPAGRHLCLDSRPSDGEDGVVVVTDASDPALARSRLAYRRGDALWLDAVSAGGVAGAPVVLDDSAGESSPSLDASATKLASTSGNAIVLRESSTRTYTVVATDERPGDLRATFTVVCGAIEHPLTGILEPTATDGTTATFDHTVDPSTLCAGGDIYVDVTDGVAITSTYIETVGENHAPSGVIVAPTSTTIGQWDPIVLVGGAHDTDGGDAALDWTVSAAATALATATGSHPEPLAPPAGGWPTGTVTVGLVASDGSAVSEAVTVDVTVLADTDGDRLPDVIEALPCMGSGAASDPANIYDDPDADALPNIVDPAPCDREADVVPVDFEPNTLFVPSSGEHVTVRFPATLAGSIDGASLRIIRVGAHVVDMPARHWSIEKDGTGVARFDRQELNRFIADHHLVGLFVPVITSAKAGGVVIRGFDAAAPVTSPGT